MVVCITIDNISIKGIEGVRKVKVLGQCLSPIDSDEMGSARDGIHGDDSCCRYSTFPFQLHHPHSCVRIRLVPDRNKPVNEGALEDAVTEDERAE